MKKESRIQKKNQSAIRAAALKVFSQHGFRGATLDQIAREAKLSKPNLLYYFESKEAIYQSLLNRLLDDWMGPIHDIDPAGDPVEEIVQYANRKLEMSRRFPRESRLFANEIVQGAQRIGDSLSGELRDVVEEFASRIRTWVAEGRIRPVDPYHLVFSIWSITQHYADFEVQVRAIIGEGDPYPGAEAHLDDMLRRLLTP